MVALSATIALATATILVACVAVPLATFTLVLALFGPAHVASELRYLDYRFSARLGLLRVRLLGALLAAAMAVRLVPAS